ncbi:uncharacterized protein ARB_00613 [Trichophyton benhamiae CBS 112371]|uniref:Reverse transcriptase Ty1/copia-type domain-containing protein n=1 Tax=Arthroderma benhamiae (strain ATCC MYA-4681 / CBS 112371) TaxID=663331 RepID=D4AWP7_ARTBC|nr:uncharacterized protein ARB_00613 [Trichophyton benhamiae CBS 112371]EFE32428.1 hypothetical protein ARB_00613 [Trichophyton benhamiae CBS 112371]
MVNPLRSLFDLDTFSMKASYIKKTFEIQGFGAANWFLSIAIERDRNAGKLWLNQRAYIEKIVKRYHLEHGKKASTPLLKDVTLAKNEGQATPGQIHEYQQKVGSVLYAAVTTRPDIAFATSKLAQSLKNPSRLHLEQVDRLICYLRDTKDLSIEYDGTHTHEFSHMTAAEANMIG